MLAIIVDDNEIDRYIVRRNLDTLAAFSHIIESQGGEQFLDDALPIVLAASSAVLVMMDIRMPGMNGFETVKALEQRTSGTAAYERLVVKIYTSSINPIDRQRAANLPLVSGYLPKPLDAAGLAEINASIAPFTQPS